MLYAEFLNAVIDRGGEAARADYTRADQANKLKGSLGGFEACRGLDPPELLGLLAKSRATSSEEALGDTDVDKYWELRCFELEVEWVCNCVSAMLVNEGKEPIVPPTSRGVLAAAQIIGV